MRTSRILTAGTVAAAIAVGAISLSPAAQAKTARTGMSSVSPGTRPAVSPVSSRAHMGSYGATRFAGAAAKLPAGLAAQLHKQLGITPEQFLADGQAAADAGKVVASLRADGVTVLGAKLAGTALTLTVPDAAGAAAAEADGATAVIGTAKPVKTVRARPYSSPADGSSPLLGGDLWFYFTDRSTGEGAACSTGFNGYDRSTGAREFLTAGHCADYQDTGEAAPADGVVYAATDTDPVTLFHGLPLQDPPLGSLDQSSFRFGGGQDSGVVKVTDAKAKPRPAVNTWGSGDTNAGASSTASQGVENRGGTVPVLAAAAAVAGAPVCHSGARTGWQCGLVTSAAVAVDVGDTTSTAQEVDSIETTVCDLPGDSGGSFVSGEYAIGLTSAGSFTPKSSSGAGYNACSGTGYTYAYPMVATVSGEESAAQSEPNFELAVTVSAPVVTTAAADVVTGAGTISGSLPRPFATGTHVSLSVDGKSTATTTVDSGGHWSFRLAGLADGLHSYKVTAGSGHSTASKSGTLSLGQVTVAGTPQVGKTLTAAVTGVPSHGTVAYQWRRSGAVVHTGPAYPIPAADAGHPLTVTAVVTEGGKSASVTGRPTAAVAKGVLAVKVKPKLSGTPAVGKKLAVATGTWSPVPAIKVQWYANGKAIARATGTSLKLTAALKGKTIGVTVTASKAGYTTATVKLTEATKVKAG